MRNIIKRINLVLENRNNGIHFDKDERLKIMKDSGLTGSNSITELNNIFDMYTFHDFDNLIKALQKIKKGEK